MSWASTPTSPMSSRSGDRSSRALLSSSSSLFAVLDSLHSLKGFVVNLLRWLSVSVLALSLVPQIALADDPPLAVRMQQHIEADFLKPLAAQDKEISPF